MNYNPPKHRRPEPASPGHIFDSDGNEMVEETEHGETLVSQLGKIMITYFNVLDVQEYEMLKKEGPS